MAYGSAAARAYYGAGDMQAAIVRAQLGARRGRPASRPFARAGGFKLYVNRGAYQAGGFGSFLKKAVKVVKKATTAATAIGMGFATGGVGGAMKAGLGLIASGGGMGPAGTGSLMQKAAQYAVQGGAGSNVAGLTTFGAPKKRSSSRKRRSSSRKRRRSTSSRRRKRRAYARGDYGDDWSGDRPSRAKHSGQFLTRAGGRRRRRRGGGGGGRVSFTTKDGRHVSFSPKRRKRRRRSLREFARRAWEAGRAYERSK
jgi:hypothetical protein